LMKEQQRRLDDLHGRVIRLETVLELALHRTTGSAQPRARSSATRASTCARMADSRG
jgi:hypothetical protein